MSTSHSFPNRTTAFVVVDLKEARASTPRALEGAMCGQQISKSPTRAADHQLTFLQVNDGQCQ